MVDGAGTSEQVFSRLLAGLWPRIPAERIAGSPGRLYDLMVTVGPAADGIVLSSRRRLLAKMRAGDADGAGREMEEHLGGLLWMRHLSRNPAQSRIAV